MLHTAIAGIAREARSERISYPLSYGPKDLEHQIDILEKRWPWIDSERARALAARLPKRPRTPAWIEAPFCIVNPDFFGTYADAVSSMLDALIDARAGYRTSVDDRLRSVFRKDGNLSGFVRRTRRTKRFHQRLCDQQPGDIWIVYGQFGWHHRNQSVEEVRRSYAEEEYGFGLVEACSMLLTHRRRLVNSAALQLECPGDMLRPHWSQEFSDAAFLHVHDGKLSIDACLASVSSKRAGSLTGILPVL